MLGGLLVVHNLPLIIIRPGLDRGAQGRYLDAVAKVYNDFVFLFLDLVDGPEETARRHDLVALSAGRAFRDAS
jgi:hypothetical protein